jgi:hypothetical protein
MTRRNDDKDKEDLTVYFVNEYYASTSCEACPFKAFCPLRKH